MRHLIALALLTTPAHAWDFTPQPVCTLSHVEAEAELTVTFDHVTGLYTIAITHPDGWPAASAFSMRFDGAQPNTISTNRHQTDAQTLTVTDTGFGNVLNGLEFNTTAKAFTQSAEVTMSLQGAAEPVQAFRACIATPIT